MGCHIFCIEEYTMLSWRTVRLALPVLLGAQLLSSCSDGHECGSRDWQHHNPPAADAGPGAQDAATTDAAVRLSNAELTAYLRVANEQQLALTSYAMTRVRGTSTMGLVAELASDCNRATARQKWLEITPAESAASASLRSMFVQAHTELEQAAADLVDLRFADAEVRLLREIVMAVQTALASRSTDPDLNEELSILNNDLTESLYAATTIRSRLREQGPDVDAGVFGVDGGGPIGHDAGSVLLLDAGPGPVQDAGPGPVQDAAASDAGT
jgi:hypothetical protein